MLTMNVAIIGAGFTGLSAAYQLTKSGHQVTIFEKDPQPGGLAIGYSEKNWEWTLEKHYHHWFANDHNILNLAKEIGHPVHIPRPRTAVYADNEIFQFDSPLHLLKFPKIPITDRLRMGFVLAILKYNPYWKPFERIHAASFLRNTMGKKGFETLWKPQFSNKFGAYSEEISLAWFWARIHKRTPSLAYPEGGFLSFANHLVNVIQKQGGHVLYEKEILEISNHDRVVITYQTTAGIKKSQSFHKAIVTLPSYLFMKIAPQLPQDYRQQLGKLKGLGATNLVLRLRRNFFHDNTYWLSVCDEKSPVMAIVEHTNLMDKKHYNNEHIVYLGNYVPADHEYFSLNEKQMLKKFDPFLKKINPGYEQNLIGMKLFKAPFAQPIIPVNYSRILPHMQTPLQNVILANIEQVYPWDRGTNYAVELGEKAAAMTISDI
jgi:protoporphyrinogen oxidase